MKEDIIDIIKGIGVFGSVLLTIIGAIILIVSIETKEKDKCVEAGGTWVEGFTFEKNYCIYGEKE